MFIFHNFSPWQVIKRVSPFHASHKARVFRECENKNMNIFASVASTWYVEDSKIDFKNENTAHGNRSLLFYKSTIIEIEKDEYFSNNCKKHSHCSQGWIQHDLVGGVHWFEIMSVKYARGICCSFKA